MVQSTYSGAMTDRSTPIALAGLAALAVAMGIGRFAFTPILPMMQLDSGLDITRGSWLASANYAGYLAGGLSAARLHMSAQRALRLSLIAVGLATLAMALSRHFAAWLALRFVAGMASAWVLVVASSWCLEQFQSGAPPARRPVLSATLFAGVGVGIALAGALCAALSISNATSTSAWIALGILALAGSAAIWNSFGPGTGVPAWSTASSEAWGPEALRMIACYGAFGFGYIIPATFLSAMAREATADPAMNGWSWPAFGAAAAASTFAAAALRRRFSDRAVWIFSHIVMAAGVVAPLAVRGLAGVVLCALLVGATFMVVTMAGLQEARRIAGPRTRSLIAAMTSAFAVGQIAGPLAVSALSPPGAGFGASLLIAALLLVASAAALVPRTSPRSSP
jgi:predicted MFS family arabinose efflux permease